MRGVALIFLFSCSYTLNLIAQPSIQWQKSFGGTGYDIASSIQQTFDGGYIVTGYSESNDGDVSGNHVGDDYWVIKLNNTGTIQWQKALGGTGYDNAYSIRQTNDSGYIIAGGSNSTDGDVTGNHGGDDFWVVKLSSTGIIQWQKSLGGTGKEEAYSIQQTTDSGYIVSGVSGSNNGDVTGNHGGMDYWVVKLNSIGTIQWQKSLGGTGNDFAYSIQQTVDSGYIVAGVTNSINGDITDNNGSYDYWIVKLDSAGTIQWQKSLGGTMGEQASSIQQTSDGGYIVAGNSASNDSDVTGNHGLSDYWVVRLNGIGLIQWQKSLGGTNGDRAYSIKQTTDSGFILTGYSQSNDSDVTGNHGNNDYWIVKLSSAGIMQWEESLGGTGNDISNSIQQTTDGGYVFAGGSFSNDGDVTGNHGNYDYWVVKLNPEISRTEEINNTFSNLQINPNPVSFSTDISFSIIKSENISINIYDLTGRLIKNLFNGHLNSGIQQFKWELTCKLVVEDGVYLLNILSENFSQSCKLVVVK